jgi:assimilatory nitrate reductase catalytic subunit
MVEPSDEVRQGQAFLPMHWGTRFLGGRGAHGINTLTVPALDPSSRQPELKHAAVRVTRAALPWRFTAFGFPAQGSAIALLDALSRLMQQFAFGSVVPFGRDAEGVLLRLADAEAPPAAILESLDAQFGLADPRAMRFDDSRLGTGRRIDVADGRLRAVRLAGGIEDVVAESWLKEWLIEGTPVDSIRRLLFLPSRTAPVQRAARGRIVCNCLNVSSDEIEACLSGLAGPPEARLASLCEQLRCGTQCGSCLPELKQRVRTA